MGSSTASVAEIPAAAPDVVPKGRAREGKSARRTGARPKGNGIGRYFLAVGQPGEEVTIGRELASEQEALVAAFQEKVTFFVLTEYRVETRFKGANALLVKEGVSRA